ncbi:kinase-like protein [Rhizophagus irregularis]|uniref:Kinase-like protein n=1 Tax=Rhizophagus irregularis TaxID=588596 RepID=A0A2I1HPH3_9GLOM|nr:kinase-like protein [Rhizophagus irregularis]
MLKRLFLTQNISGQRVRALAAIYRDLHSGNILYSQFNNTWCISDLGFCGPADKPSESIYGNLPYIAPEVIVGREYTFASDIYSIAILMWEISSGQPPFINYEHENDIVMNIINGIRPKIVPGTPLEYKNLMANNIETNYTSSKLLTSKIHNFENLPEPRNATEEEQEAFHSKPYDFSIPNNINDFNGSNKQNSNKSSKIINIFKDSNKGYLNYLKVAYKNNDEKEIIQQKMKRQSIYDIDDDDEVYNNPNLHSKEQIELEIPDDGF